MPVITCSSVKNLPDEEPSSDVVSLPSHIEADDLLLLHPGHGVHELALILLLVAVHPGTGRKKKKKVVGSNTGHSKNYFYTELYNPYRKMMSFWHTLILFYCERNPEILLE